MAFGLHCKEQVECSGYHVASEGHEADQQPNGQLLRRVLLEEDGEQYEKNLAAAFEDLEPVTAQGERRSEEEVSCRNAASLSRAHNTYVRIS